MFGNFTSSTAHPLLLLGLVAASCLAAALPTTFVEERGVSAYENLPSCRSQCEIFHGVESSRRKRADGPLISRAKVFHLFEGFARSGIPESLLQSCQAGCERMYGWHLRRRSEMDDNRLAERDASAPGDASVKARGTGLAKRGDGTFGIVIGKQSHLGSEYMVAVPGRESNQCSYAQSKWPNAGKYWAGKEEGCFTTEHLQGDWQYRICPGTDGFRVRALNDKTYGWCLPAAGATTAGCTSRAKFNETFNDTFEALYTCWLGQRETSHYKELLN